jgi:hypothetical protein
MSLVYEYIEDGAKYEASKAYPGPDKVRSFHPYLLSGALPLSIEP